MYADSGRHLPGKAAADRGCAGASPFCTRAATGHTGPPLSRSGPRRRGDCARIAARPPIKTGTGFLMSMCGSFRPEVRAVRIRRFLELHHTSCLMIQIAVNFPLQFCLTTRPLGVIFPDTRVHPLSMEIICQDRS